METMSLGSARARNCGPRASSVLAAALSVVLVQGCWTTSTVVVNSERGAPFVREQPLGADAPYRVTSTVEDQGVRVAVTPTQCVTRTETPVTDHKTQTTRSSVWTSVLAGVIGGGLVGVGTYAWVRRSERPDTCPSDHPDCTTKAGATTGAVVLWGLGAAVIGYGVYRLVEPAEHKELSTERRVEAEQSAQHACKGTGDGVMVELRLPGGSVSARADASGQAWLPIEDARIAQLRRGGSFPLIVGGVSVDPIVLDTLIAAWSQRTGSAGTAVRIDPTMLGSFSVVDGCVPGQAYRVSDASKLPDDYGEDAPAVELWGCGWNIATGSGRMAFPGAVSRTSYVVRHYGVFFAPADGRYAFWIAGSLPWRLSVDGGVLLSSDGHRDGALNLTRGEHRMLLEYLYTAGAPFQLSFESQAPNGTRQPFVLGRGSPYYAIQSVRYVGQQRLDTGWQSLAKVDADEIKISEQIHFETDRAEIDRKDKSESVLYAVAEVLGDHPDIKRVEVQGHTDDVGGDAHNMDLSWRRARAVRDWLINAGIAPYRLAAAGYGKTRPIASNATPDGRAQNRRVQFVIGAAAESEGTAITTDTSEGATAAGTSGGDSNAFDRLLGPVVSADAETGALLPKTVGAYALGAAYGLMHRYGFSAMGEYHNPAGEKLSLLLIIAAAEWTRGTEKRCSERVAGHAVCPDSDGTSMNVILSLHSAAGFGKAPKAVLDTFANDLDVRQLTSKVEARLAKALPKAKKPSASRSAQR